MLTASKETVYIIPIADDAVYRAVIAAASDCLSAFGAVGVSEILRDISRLHTAYQQAHGMLAQGASMKAVNIYSKQLAPLMERGVYVSPDQLIALQNAITFGNISVVTAFFDDISEKSRAITGINHLQIFFTLRQLLMRMSQASAAAHEKLSYMPDENVEDSIRRLKDYAVALAARLSQINASASSHIADKILQIIESDFANPNMSANYIADVIHFSEKYVYQVVKERTRQTVGDIIEDTRFKFSLELLNNTDKTNEEIAVMCGFSSVNTFYRVFKKKLGVSPGEYRRTNSRVG